MRPWSAAAGPALSHGTSDQYVDPDLVPDANRGHAIHNGGTAVSTRPVHNGNGPSGHSTRTAAAGPGPGASPGAQTKRPAGSAANDGTGSPPQ